ncbi:MAG TPA: OsmC family peroxiredoxin [Planctomycetes bacterium]|nr:OsmC family peroxiredoxin [Planctomycetota bacterium]
MEPLPHTYKVKARVAGEDLVDLTGEGLEPLKSGPPPQFGGPGGLWSPEELFVAAAADCFLLTFRSVAKHSSLDWKQIECETAGTLEKTEGGLQFTRLVSRVRLVVPEGTDEKKASRVLEMSEKNCLVTRSLKCELALETEILTE